MTFSMSDYRLGRKPNSVDQFMPFSLDKQREVTRRAAKRQGETFFKTNKKLSLRHIPHMQIHLRERNFNPRCPESFINIHVQIVANSPAQFRVVNPAQ
jgi:hypothetical protein